MTETQRKLIEAANAWRDARGGRINYGIDRDLIAAVDADRASTEPEPEALTAEAQALLEAVLEYVKYWRKDLPDDCANVVRAKVLRSHDTYLASLKPKLEVSWPDAAVIKEAFGWAVYSPLLQSYLHSGGLWLRSLCNEFRAFSAVFQAESDAADTLRRMRITKLINDGAKPTDAEAAVAAFEKGGAK